MTRVAVLVLVLACAIVPAASAQLKKAGSPVGDWEFKTAEHPDSCTISGTMSVAATNKKGRFTCTFKAVQACTRREFKTIHTEQSCVVEQVGSSVEIKAKVEKIVSVDPKWMIAGMRYAPDDFHVKINESGSEMRGDFESIGEIEPVKFWRTGELLS
ncbi:unnamed protein product [Phaeothamnion confervicola]